MSSDAGPVSFALLPEWRSEARARRPSQRPQVRRGRRQPQPSPGTPALTSSWVAGVQGEGRPPGRRRRPAAWRGLRWGSLARASLTPREDAGCNLDPEREGPGSQAPPGYLLFFICFLLPGRRRKAQRKGKGRTEAARAAAPVPSRCAGARREARYFSLQIGSLRGLAATRKCILVLRAAEGAGQGRHSPAQPRASLETLGTRRGPAAGGVTSPSFLLLPFHVGPATWGDASSGGPQHGPPGGSGSIRPPPRPLSRPALYSAPRLQLPPGPRAGHGCCPMLVRSGAGRPQGALALPDPRSGRTCQGGSAGCGARGDWSVCWNLPRCVRCEKRTVFTHLEMSFCWLDVAGAILKALPLVKSPASLEALRARGSHVRCPFAIMSPQVFRCIAIGIWTLNDDGAQRPRETSQHLG
ncbi:uncharacterized protein LOC127679177 [Apodemus sylvaticus]|uniref:uncharacterized protein LOC127679177 n=1 Tax=Apodemus sylvaticus TaxID=10129 RepID=UPI0022422791|nr:uncharacterized protein LOC127679177 [Apodemus sylvaticus]